MTWTTVSPSLYHADSYASSSDECFVSSDRGGCWFYAEELVRIDQADVPALFDSLRLSIVIEPAVFVDLELPTVGLVVTYSGSFDVIDLSETTALDVVIPTLSTASSISLALAASSLTQLPERLITISYFSEVSDFWTNKVRTSEVI